MAFPTQLALELLRRTEGIGDLLECSSCSDLTPEEWLNPLNLQDFSRVPFPGN